MSKDGFQVVLGDETWMAFDGEMQTDDANSKRTMTGVDQSYLATASPLSMMDASTWMDVTKVEDGYTSCWPVDSDPGLASAPQHPC